MRLTGYGKCSVTIHQSPGPGASHVSSLVITRSVGGGVRAARHLVGPQLRRHRHRAAVGRRLGGAGVAVGERRRFDPGEERRLVAPPRDHQPRVARVGRPQQLETLEAVLVVDGTGPAANRFASSGPASSATVMALILITVMHPIKSDADRIRHLGYRAPVTITYEWRGEFGNDEMNALHAKRSRRALRRVRVELA